jgi:NAD(P)-dependent dehydrogenase (short-subunit alcohol dehydrogenase family)
VILEGSAAIVTGGAGGLGAATVRRLVALGVRVVVLDLDGDRARELAAELGDVALGVGGDVTDDDDVGDAIEAATSLGPLSVLVNVAGGGVGGGRTVSRDGKPHDLASFATTMEMNAVGTFNVSRLVAAAMGANEPDGDGQRGVIVNTASIAGMEGMSGQVAYAAAKAAILGMTLPMARDLAPIGIRVCAIAPGTMGTPLMLAALEHLRSDPSEGIVFPKRMGDPDEFALLVESIIRNPYLNGENIRLDGALRFTATRRSAHGESE